MSDYALSVGISTYPGLDSVLPGAEADAADFHEWVTKVAGVQHATLILSSQFPQSAAPSNAQPASQQIWTFFESLRTAASANNAANNGFKCGRRLYLFFSGHGFSPSLDASGTLMANAERATPHNLAMKAWADRFYENGLFDEVLLFQDACREAVGDIELTPPYFKRTPKPGANQRKRFYAFAAKTPLIALDKQINGKRHGVFSATLMAGLNGGARDPQTGEITSAQLKSYLVANMASRLDKDDLAKDDVCQRPEVFDLDPIVILPPVPDFATKPLFPVEIALGESAPSARILDAARKDVVATPAGMGTWSVELPIGLYELEIAGRPPTLFKVSGALDSHGKPEVVHVR